MNRLQRAIIGRGEIAAKAPRVHAEITALDKAAIIGATPSKLALVPVEHDAFSTDDTVQQARSQLTTQPQRLETEAVHSDIGAPRPAPLVRDFHKGLDVHLPRRLRTAYYESLGPTERQQVLQKLAAYTKNFDAEHGTKLYDALLKNGFPAP